jgi:hypothetical protein
MVIDGRNILPSSRFHPSIMSRDIQLKERWENVVKILSNQFAEGDELDLDAIIYLIGVQELGKVKQTFKKDEKINLMHIAICRLLEPYGYYEFEFYDNDGWPHYKVKEELPPLKAGEQSVLMKEAIVNYFLEREVIK